VLGEYLTEVNVTSPTGLQEMNRLYQKTLENDVIAFAEKLVQQRKAST
jgi:glutathione synthase